MCALQLTSKYSSSCTACAAALIQNHEKQGQHNGFPSMCMLCWIFFSSPSAAVQHMHRFCLINPHLLMVSVIIGDLSRCGDGFCLMGDQ